MRIQHNIMALNAYRQLGGNNSALAKNLEKLSSGYAINRAGDDAAGLAISEKMRAQIKGLEAAQKNANDGISLVQTAEGALTEVHSMLNRMVYLATQSANGTYDNEVDRANLDKEVQTLKEEIDRISQSTNFNGLKLLDGSMDGNATKTTGGTTDVPILQNVAKNPTQEVGTATVLHKDADEVARTEINAELHDVNITAKSKEGDVIRFQVGDNTIELELGRTGSEDLANGVLEAGKNYNSTDIAKAIEGAFNKDGNNLIGGQIFQAVATNNRITFTQKADPQDVTEVVDANVDVKIDYVNNPAGNPVEYTAKIKSDDVLPGATINIGGDEYVLGKGDFKDALTLEDAFPSTPGAEFETKSGYKVTYDKATSTLTIKDPNGTLGKPSVKIDTYASPGRVNTTSTPAKSEVKASATLSFADLGLAAGFTPKNGDVLTIGAESYTFDEANNTWDTAAGVTPAYTITAMDDGSGLKIESTEIGAAGNAAGGVTSYTIAANTTGANLTLADGADSAQASGSATGVSLTAGALIDGLTLDLTDPANPVVGGTSDNYAVTVTQNAVDNTKYDITITAKVGGSKDGDAGNEDVTVGGVAITMEDGEDAVAATATHTLAYAPKNGDTIVIDPDGDNLTFTFDETTKTWGLTSGTNNDNVTVTGTGTTLTIGKGGVEDDGTQHDANGFNGALKVGDYTYAARGNANVSLAGGETATSAVMNVDKLADGSKVKLTAEDGTELEFVFTKDWATTLTSTVDDGTGAATTVKDAIEALFADHSTSITNGETFTVAEANGKLQITSSETGKAGVDPADDTVLTGSHVPEFKITASPKQNTTLDATAPANAATISGTWNVQSTNNTQGASANGGQLASTTFDLTADMVKDGNTLTIGKDTYIFKVGKDSTTQAGTGQILIDLSKYEADSEELIDGAGAVLANQTNGAFTIGYADNGKISIHEKEGQTQFKNGELESVEEFDKLVYMNSPEVTEATGKGLTFQVGDTADDFQKVALNIKDMSSEGLGIADVNIATIDDAASAIDKIKAAINTVSSQRGDLGAIQNRLEHTINNLGVQTENITAAESRIRDTDMAQEMMAYTKNNILVQAAQAMLAQANQVPQGILQLLQ